MGFTEAEIEQALNTSEETGQVEFKINAPRDSELAERICGFANSRTGGIILFGVANGTAHVAGLTKPHATIDAITRALRLVRPDVPIGSLGPEVLTVHGQRLVALRLVPNQGDLFQSGGVFWIRKGSHTVPMSRAEVEARLHNTGATRWEKAVCSRTTLQDLDQTLIERYRTERTGRRRSLAQVTVEDLLTGLECVVRDTETGTLHPTRAGMLLFGRQPQLFIPHSEVVCIQYPERLGLVQWIDRQIMEGTLSEMIDQTAEFITRRIARSARIQGFKREDRPEYPLEALREAVVNAVAHRDYSLEGESIRVFLFPDRIEIRSPGGLMPGITPEDLAQLRVSSRPRNPLIVQLLRDLPGYMERVGMGIRLMVNQMQAAGLPNPEFIEQHDFVVIFRNGQALTGDTTGQLNARQLQAWQIVQERGSISTGEYVAATGAAERTALRELSAMIDLGLFVRQGKGRGARYYRP